MMWKIVEAPKLMCHNMKKLTKNQRPTAHLWCGGHFTNINACEVWGERARVQNSRRKFHTHIHLD